MTGRHRGRGLARRKQKTEGDEYAAFVVRLIWRWAIRAAEDPAELAYLRAFEAALHDAPNVAIALANKSGEQPYSLAELAAILGTSRPAVHKRMRLGIDWLRHEPAGKPVVRVKDMRQIRAAVFEAAGIPDPAASPRELNAGSDS